MAENKTSVIFLKDWSILIQSLSSEKQLVFWSLFMQYNSDLECNDEVVKPIWNFIKSQLINMENKYQENIVNRNKINGLKGGRPKTQDKPNNPVGLLATQITLNVNENVNNNVNVKENNIEERKLKFANTLKPFLETYGKDLLNDFFKYWTEPNKSNTKFKQELEKTWSLERRLETWSNNDKNFNKDKKQITTTNYPQL